MKKFFFLFFAWLPVSLFAQTDIVQNSSIPKDAQVDVTVTDFKKNILPHEIMIFKSQKNEREYQGMTDDNGKFSIRLPAGDKYDMFILGFKDSTSYDFLDIPAVTGNAYYGKPFVMSFQFQPAKNWVLEGCNFEFGKANLLPESYAVIDDLIVYLTRKDDERIELGGHTDNIGKPASNLQLSLDRANAVRDYMLAKGIAPERITTKGYGMTKPLSDNRTEEGRAENRRTEVIVLE